MISVNITTHNRPQHLDRCLQSFLSERDQILEIIIVNDGSPRGYGDVIEKYVDKLPIKFIQNASNLGNARSRNIALLASSGRYISLMDDDDFVLGGKYLDAQDAMQSDVDLIFSAVWIIGNDKCETTQYCFLDSAELFKAILSSNSIIYSPSVIVRSEIAKQIRFDEQVQKGVDSFFYRRVLSQSGVKVAYLSDPKTCIDESSTNSMTRGRDKQTYKRTIISEMRNIRFFWRYYSVRNFIHRIGKIIKASLYYAKS